MYPRSIFALMNDLTLPVAPGLQVLFPLVGGIMRKFIPKDIRRRFTKDFFLRPAVEHFRRLIPTQNGILHIGCNHGIRNALDDTVMEEQLLFGSLLIIAKSIRLIHIIEHSLVASRRVTVHPQKKGNIFSL